MADNTVEITVRTRDESAAGIDSATTRAGRLKAKFGEVATMAGGMLAGQAIQAGMGLFNDLVSGSVESASNLGESLNAVNVVFKDQAKVITDWGRNNAASFGLSQQAFNNLAVPLGAMLSNAGLSMQDTSKWTVDLTKRAADMASVFNTDVSDAMEAIQAGLRGEADPLERFGVSLSAAAVEAQALSETGKKTGKSLTDQEKATARLNLIMKQTAKVQGDFTNTSDGLANSQRIGAAEAENFKAQLGEKMLPVTLALTKAKMALVTALVTYVLPAFNSLSEWVAKYWPYLVAVGVGILAALVPSFIAWATAAWAAAAGTIAATWPLIAIGLAIAAVAAALIYAYKHSETFRLIVQTSVRAVGAAFSWVADLIGNVVQWIRDHWSQIRNIIMMPVRLAVAYVTMQWRLLQSSVELAIRAVIFVFVTLPTRIRNAVGNLRNTLTQKGAEVIQGFLDGLLNVWRKVTDWIGGIAKWIKDHKGPESLDKTLLTPAGEHIMNGFWTGLKKGAGPIGQWLQQFTGQMAESGGASLQGTGYMRQMAALRAHFGNVPMYSGFRPGSRTVSGNMSYHAMGRAVDLPPSMAIFNWIRETFGRNTKELIFTPAGGRQIKNGRDYTYTGAVAAQHKDHVHWAYDDGGWLMPGTTIAHNNTGRPEMILTDQRLDEAINRTGGRSVVLEIATGGSALDDLLLEILRRSVRVRGGNVQTVIGRG